MNLIAHRRNKLEELKASPTQYGVEVDIRSHGDQMIIHHDAFQAGELFENWIAAYRHGTLILNVKEEGLEARLIAAMKERGIEDYFFLDQSFPFLVKWSKLGERRCAVRLSEFENVEVALSLAGKVNWVWVDCFSYFPLTNESANRLHDAGFKICLASPELHGHEVVSGIADLRKLLAERKIVPDAVCTKRTDLWLS